MWRWLKECLRSQWISVPLRNTPPWVIVILYLSFLLPLIEWWSAFSNRRCCWLCQLSEIWFARVFRLVWTVVLLSILQPLWHFVDLWGKFAFLVDYFHGYHSLLANCLSWLVPFLRLHECLKSVIDNPAQFVLVEGYEHADDVFKDEDLMPLWSEIIIH